MKKKPQHIKYVTRDNAGIRSCYSVNIKFLCCSLGEILASISRVNNTKFKKGDLVRLLTLGSRARHRRRGGIVSSLGYNGAIALKKDGSPVGTRLWGPVLIEARPAGYLRLAVLARGLL